MLRIQDPEDPHGEYLLEEVLDAANVATEGGGAFAWATARGVELLLRDTTFETFCADGTFQLVVGLDAVTDPAALESLAEAEEALIGLTVEVFLHNRSRSLFHPKFLWFSGDHSATLIAGSGNLSEGGLRRNWEVYTVDTLDDPQLGQVRERWEDWYASVEANLVSPTDERARLKAEQNSGWEGRGGDRPSSPEDETDEDTDGDIQNTSLVLMAQIPRSGDRWKQANFDLETYTDFFGAEPGSQRRILLQHVESDGSLGPLESRPSVEVNSQNYRFELGAGSGIEYPDDDRPIGVFIRLQDGTFLYHLLLPSDDEFATVDSLLRERWDGREDRMARITVTVDELRDGWPDSPFWNITGSPVTTTNT